MNQTLRWLLVRSVQLRPVAVLLWGGLRAQPLGIAAALAAAWLGCALAIEAAAAGAIGGALWVLLAFSLRHAANPILTHIANTPYSVGVDGAFLIFSVLLGALSGAIGGALAALTALLSNPGVVEAALVCGLLVALGLVGVVYYLEHWLLLRRGFRRLAWEEDLRVYPLLEALAVAMAIDVDTVPSVLVVDTALPEAHAHLRALVVSRGLLEALDDHQLAGVLAHELAHWRTCDPAGLWLVWAAALPLSLIHGVLGWCLGSIRSALIRSVIQLFFWPVDLAVRLLVAPAVARNSRTCEYAADAAAAAAGAVYRDGLKEALRLLTALEAPRNGWEAALIRSHPPTALRIERLVSTEEACTRAAVLQARAEAKEQRQQAGR